MWCVVSILLLSSIFINFSLNYLEMQKELHGERLRVDKKIN